MRYQRNGTEETQEERLDKFYTSWNSVLTTEILHGNTSENRGDGNCTFKIWNLFYQA